MQLKYLIVSENTYISVNFFMRNLPNQQISSCFKVIIIWKCQKIAFCNFLVGTSQNPDVLCKFCDKIWI